MKNIHMHFLDMRDAGNDALMIANDTGKDILRKRALERCFEIMGEAAKRIPRERQPEWPQIPWKDIIDLRNAISHEYESFTLHYLCDITRRDVPSLLSAIELILKNYEV